MPIFFDKNKLTDTQKDNWDHAMNVYSFMRDKAISGLSPLLV